MNIKKRIKERGFTLEEVGAKMQKPMSQQSMSMLLRDGGNPTLNKLIEIASILGISLSELVADEISPASECSVTCPHCGGSITLEVAVKKKE